MNKKLILKISISLALLLVIYFNIDKEVTIRYLKGIKASYLPIIFLLLLLNYFVSSLRWKKLLSVFEGTSHISVLFLTKLYFIGAFFNNFLPTSIGGDVYKAFRLGKFINNQSYGFASTFMERFSGVVVLSLLSSFGLISTYKNFGILLAIGFWAAVILVFVALNHVGKFVKKIAKFNEAMSYYKKDRKVLVYALFTSVFVQVFSILTQYFVFRALGFDISLAFSFFAFPVIILASFIIPSQNSFGVQDALYAGFFARVGVPIEGAISASVVYHLVRLITSLVGGIFYATER